MAGRKHSKRKRLACRCGSRTFAIRIDPTEMVGLLTCIDGHASLLLDSGDYWHERIQNGRPKEAHCRCKARMFEVALGYEFRADSGAVRSVSVTLRCSECQHERDAATFEIDYEPTDVLVKKPLEPVDDPWRKARQHTFTGLWTPSDAVDVAHHLVKGEGLRAHLKIWNQPARAATLASLRAALSRKGGYLCVVFGKPSMNIGDDPSGLWRAQPLVELSSPTNVNYLTGAGFLYYLHFADEVFEGTRVVKQSEEFRALTARVRSWLESRFDVRRGRGCFDTPEERRRLFPDR